MVCGARRSMLRLVLAATAVALVALTRSAVCTAQACAHYTQDALLDRLDARLATCIDEQRHRAALDIVKDRFAANEFDRQQPLALAAFSNSSQTLDAFAGAIASALFGSSAATRTHVQVLDLAKLIPSTMLASTTRDVKHAMRAALGAALAACPARSLIVVENVQKLDDAVLPALDAFLDPLNGARAHLQVHTAGGKSELLDASRAVFLFLFQVEHTHFVGALQTAEMQSTASSGNIAVAAKEPEPQSQQSQLQTQTWRDFLMRLWTRQSGLIEEFTPQAFVGRLTDGVALFASDNADELLLRQQHAQQCFAHKKQLSNDREIAATDVEANKALQRLAWAALPLLALLYRTKLWTQDVAIKRAARGPIRSGKRSHTKRSKRSGSSSSSSSSKKSRKRS